MVGGGQLGRMFAMAAASMGYRVVVLCENADDPAAQVTHDAVVGRLDQDEVVDRFAAQCDVISLEFENIPAETIARCGRHAPTFPDASVLAAAQDRLLEKSTFRDAGLPVTPFVAVDDRTAFDRAVEQLGLPLVLKTARSGYDGKGQHRIDTIADADAVPWDSSARWIAEQWIAFQRELSVVVARTPSGQVACFPVFENQHRNHILDLSQLPADISPQVADQARQIATRAAETLDVVGLLCVEMFQCEDRLLINEVAPRPHNSGHLTIEACHTSQFEQHVRSVCDLPLGDPGMKAGAAVMVNLLGDLWPADGRSPDWSSVVAEPGVCLHLYGKAVAKPGRKMGHLTAVGPDRERLVQTVLKAREAAKR
jgi:5-(carboxyamino)imidazole ribonucleotide synthase